MALQWLSLWRQKDRSYFLWFIHTVSLTTMCIWPKEGGGGGGIKNERTSWEPHCGNAIYGCRTFQGHSVHIWIYACETVIRYGQAVHVDLLSAPKQNSVAQFSIWIHGQWSKMLFALVPALPLTSPGPIFHLYHWILSLNQGEDSSWESFMNS